MMEKKSPRGRSLTAATLHNNAMPDRRPCTAVAITSVLLSGRRLMVLALLLMVNRRSWMVDLTSTRLVGTTLNTWMRLLEKRVRMITTETIMQPRTISAGLTASLFLSTFFFFLDMFLAVSSTDTISSDSFIFFILSACTLHIIQLGYHGGGCQESLQQEEVQLHTNQSVLVC